MYHEYIKKKEAKDIARRMADSRYDSLAYILEELSLKIERDACFDEKKGRKKLSKELVGAAEKIKEAQTHIKKAWDISKPFMEES